MRRAFPGTIKYRIKESHPDKNLIVGGWSPDKIFIMSDTYYMNYDPLFDDIDSIKEFIKHDLLLVAGGGYNTKDVELVSFEC